MAGAEIAYRVHDPPGAEDRLAALARAGGPLRRVMAGLAAQLVERKRFERLGYARLSDYARERLGLSARTVQELARVGRVLGERPGLEAALVSGWLPWSKVRLLARFVSAENERHWIAHARGLGVRQLERELRAVDRGALEAGAWAGEEEGGDGEPTERVFIRGRARVCFHWQRTREYASRTAGERLPNGALLEMVTAEVLSALPLEAEASAPAGASWEELPREPPSSGEAKVCAPQVDDPEPLPEAEIPAFLKPLLAGLADADAFELDTRLRRAVRLEQRLDAEIAPLLRRVACSEYEWRLRYRTVAAFAREQLGISPRKARALLRLERAGDACPALRAAWRDGRLSWVQAQTLVPLVQFDAEGSWREAWVAHAERVSLRRLEDQVEDALALRTGAPALWEQHRAQPEGFGSDLARGAASVCAKTDREEAIRLTLTAPREVARLFRATLCTLRLALERETGGLPSEGEALEAMLEHALNSWGADDPWLRKRIRSKYRVFDRDGWRCTVPGCSARKNLHSHHIVFRSAGGGDELENQTTLCAFHHQRGVHAGLVRVHGSAPAGLTFELGIRPGLPPLERYGPADRRVA